MNLPLICAPLEVKDPHSEDHFFRVVIFMVEDIVLQHVAACGEQSSIILMIFASQVSTSRALSNILEDLHLSNILTSFLGSILIPLLATLTPCLIYGVPLPACLSICLSCLFSCLADKAVISVTIPSSPWVWLYQYLLELPSCLLHYLHLGSCQQFHSFLHLPQLLSQGTIVCVGHKYHCFWILLLLSLLFIFILSSFWYKVILISQSFSVLFPFLHFFIFVPWFVFKPALFPSKFSGCPLVDGCLSSPMELFPFSFPPLSLSF